MMEMVKMVKEEPKIEVYICPCGGNMSGCASNLGGIL